MNRCPRPAPRRPRAGSVHQQWTAASTRRYPEVFARFDHLFFSHRLRRRKPDPAAFAAVAGHLGASGPEIVFIDDSPVNVAAARAAGWHGFDYHDVAQLRHDLARVADQTVMP
jgi:HAD superfamily hydrolase (TIGR01509 family)